MGAEPGQVAEDGAADAAGAHHPHRQVVQLPALKALKAVILRQRAALDGLELAGHHQHEHHGIIRHAVRAVGGVGKFEAERPAGLHIQVVKADAAGGDVAHPLPGQLFQVLAVQQAHRIHCDGLDSLRPGGGLPVEIFPQVDRLNAQPGGKLVKGRLFVGPIAVDQCLHLIPTPFVQFFFLARRRRAAAVSAAILPCRRGPARRPGKLLRRQTAPLSGRPVKNRRLEPPHQITEFGAQQIDAPGIQHRKGLQRFGLIQALYGVSGRMVQNDLQLLARRSEARKNLIRSPASA